MGKKHILTTRTYHPKSNNHFIYEFESINGDLLHFIVCCFLFPFAAAEDDDYYDHCNSSNTTSHNSYCSKIHRGCKNRKKMEMKISQGSSEVNISHIKHFTTVKIKMPVNTNGKHEGPPLNLTKIYNSYKFL